MPEETIAAYIQENILGGFSKEVIIEQLKKSGWHKGDIEAAFTLLQPKELPKLPEPATTSTSGVVFDLGPSMPADSSSPLALETEIRKDPTISELQREASIQALHIEAEEAAKYRKPTYETDEDGVYGWMIRNNFAADKQSTNILFITILFGVLVLLYWAFLH